MSKDEAAAAVGENRRYTCGDCYWYSDVTLHICEREKELTSEDQEACPMFDPKEE